MNTPHSAPPLLTPVALRDALKPVLENLEIERRRAAKRRSSHSVAFIGAASLLWLLLLYQFGLHIGLSLLVAAPLPAFVFLGHIADKAAHDYREKFKHLVLPTLMRAFGDFRYSPRGFVSEDDFRRCRLFREPSSYRGEDLLEGRIGATNLRVSEIEAVGTTVVMNTKGAPSQSCAVLFRGLFCVIDFNKNLVGTTLVYTDFTRETLRICGNSTFAPQWNIMHQHRQTVKLEDPEFAREFVVYADDQTEARYVLSPVLMQRLVELKKRVGWLHASFVKGTLYLALPSDFAFLEPPPLSKPLSFGELRGSLEHMSLIASLVRDLDLNTRVWNKVAPSDTMPPFPVTPS